MARALVIFVSFAMLAACKSDASINDAATDLSAEIDTNAKIDLEQDGAGSDGASGDSSVEDQATDRPRDHAGADQEPQHDQSVDFAADSSEICQQLIADFAKLLAEVKQCNPYTAMNECTLKIPDSLDCPCDTFVNSGKVDKVYEMENLDKQWKSHSCVSQGCPPTPCLQPTGGVCQHQTGSIGKCEDILP